MATETSQLDRPQRLVAMALALVTAILLSPLYVKRKEDTRFYETRLIGSGFVLPLVLACLIIAIRTTSSSSQASSFSLPDASSVFRIGGSSLGLAGLLAMLVFMVSCRSSVQEFLYK